jgi:putative transposase
MNQMANNKQENLVLTEQETLEQVVNCLSQNICVNSTDKFDKNSLFQVLVRAASKHDTIENSCKELKQATCGNNIRYHLKKIHDLIKLEKEINVALKQKIPLGLKNKSLNLAIDFNLIPYYGKTNEEEKPYICRSQAKNGTCSFYGYATLYVIKKGKRVTLAIRAIRRKETKVCILTHLLSELSSLNIRVEKLYLDREFFSIAIIRWLQTLDIPFIMPAVRRGKKGGIKQFMKGRKSDKTKYKMSKNKEDYVDCSLAIICKYKKGKRKQKGREYYVYVTHKIKTNLQHIHKCYRERFGIESSYRMKNMCRIRTTSKKPTWRLLFVGISFLLINIWVNILWLKVSKPRKGGRLIYNHLFSLKQMLSFLNHAVERIFQVERNVYIPKV